MVEQENFYQLFFVASSTSGLDQATLDKLESLDNKWTQAIEF
jgi:hypothetical protein